MGLPEKKYMHIEGEAVDQLEELLQRVDSLEMQLQSVFERNQRVEADKHWELSLVRTLCIALLTYISTAAVFYLIGIDNFLLSAFIPTIGYLLSTLSLSYLRRLRGNVTSRKEKALKITPEIHS